VLGALSIAPGGTLDLTDNQMFINYTIGADPIATIATQIASGYAGGLWIGTGIISSTAANTGYALGYADSADPGNPANLPANQIKVMYTLQGDADLNGIVNGVDFGILAPNLNKGVSGWDEGDFDYNNVVNGVDFGDLAPNMNKAVALPPANLVAIIVPPTTVSTSTNPPDSANS
jgi:hypothetical protein